MASDERDHPAERIGHELFADLELSDRAQTLLALSLCDGDDRLHSYLIAEWMNRESQAELADRVESITESLYLDGSSETVNTILKTLGDEDVLIVDNPHKIRNFDDMYRPMVRGDYNHTKSQEIHEWDGTIFAVSTPEHGLFDRHQPVGSQLPLSPNALSLFDVIVASVDAAPLPKSNTPTADLADAKATIDSANNYDPTISDQINARLYRIRESFKIKHNEVVLKGSEDIPPAGIEHTDLTNLVRAAARARHSEAVSDDDMALIERVLLKQPRTLPEEKSDADVLESGPTQSQRDRIKYTKEVLSMLMDEHDGAVPFEDLADTMEQNNIDEEKLDQTLEKLMEKGDIMEPRNDEYQLI